MRRSCKSIEVRALIRQAVPLGWCGVGRLSWGRRGIGQARLLSIILDSKSVPRLEWGWQQHPSLMLSPVNDPAFSRRVFSFYSTSRIVSFEAIAYLLAVGRICPTVVAQQRSVHVIVRLAHAGRQLLAAKLHAALGIAQER